METSDFSLHVSKLLHFSYLVHISLTKRCFGCMVNDFAKLPHFLTDHFENEALH